MAEKINTCGSPCDADKDKYHDNIIRSLDDIRNEFERVLQINQSLASQTAVLEKINLSIQKITEGINNILNGGCGCKKIFDELFEIEQEKKDALEKEVLQLKQEKRILEKKITYDKLTGAFNRYHFENVFTEVTKNTPNNQGKTLSIAMIDIDNFKGINDQYGHVQGDIVLKFIGEFIHKYLEKADALFRYGGEEFTILSRRKKDNLHELLKKIIQELNHTEIFLGNNLPPIKITISAGIEQFNLDTMKDNPVKLIDRADKQLYFAKNNGKNQVRGGEKFHTIENSTTFHQ